MFQAPPNVPYCLYVSVPLTIIFTYRKTTQANVHSWAFLTFLVFRKCTVETDV